MEAAKLDAAKLPFPIKHPIIGSNPISSEIDILQVGQHTADIMNELGISEIEQRQLVAEGAIEKDVGVPKL